MRSAAVIAASAALVAGANAWGNDTIVYTTEVLTAYTTYCPAATSIVHNSKTYTVTEVSSSSFRTRISRAKIVTRFIEDKANIDFPRRPP